MNAASLQGTWGKRAMKTVLLGAVVAITSTLAHAEDMAEMISRYRHTHGLSTVKTDPQLTAIAERQAKAMAASGIMDHNVAGSFTARISGVRTSMAAENIAAGSGFSASRSYALYGDEVGSWHFATLRCDSPPWSLLEA
jgi:hypothetical protein